MSAKHVLIIEDTAEDREAIRRALRAYDPALVISQAQDGDSALALLRELEGLGPTLVFIDLHLSGDEGMDIIGRIRCAPTARFAPIVVLSASTNPQDIQACYRLGVHGYCVKSIDRGTFEHNVAIICEYWFSCVHLPS